MRGSFLKAPGLPSGITVKGAHSSFHQFLTSSLVRDCLRVEQLVCIFRSKCTEPSVRLRETDNLNLNVIKHRAAHTPSPSLLLPFPKLKSSAVGHGAECARQDHCPGLEATQAHALLPSTRGLLQGGLSHRISSVGCTDVESMLFNVMGKAKQ